MNQDQHIILDKELRRDIDAIIDRIKCGTGERNTPSIPTEEQRRSRERSIAITKLQEAVMWLGMDLKAINDETPQPVRDLNQPSSEAICAAIDEARLSQESTSDRVTGSYVQAAIDKALGRGPYPNSKDPSNTKIDATADGLKL